MVGGEDHRGKTSKRAGCGVRARAYFLNTGGVVGSFKRPEGNSEGGGPVCDESVAFLDARRT